MEVFVAPYARHYDLLYADKDYAAEAGYVRDLLRRAAPSATRLLELGSGTGRHAALLASMGYSVHGVEQSAPMLEAATRSAAAGCEFSLGDLRSVRLGTAFDAVISLFHVIGYQTTNEDLSAAFATARAHLKPGGVFLFDYWYGPAVLHQKPSARVKRVGDDSLHVTRIAEPELLPNEDVVIVNYHLFIRDAGTDHITETRERHCVRYLFLPEIARILSQQSFRLEHSEEWLTGQPLGLDTWCGVTLARAI